MTVRGVAFLGVGSIVGAGILAVLGEAAGVAGSAVRLSFLLAGGVSRLLTYDVVRLGIRHPSSAGRIESLLSAAPIATHETSRIGFGRRTNDARR